MDILVIGGGGGLGRLVCAELATRGHHVTPLGRKDGDLRDPEVIAKHGARVIVNCAGASVAMGLGKGWRGYRAVDVPIGHAAIKAAHSTNARLIYVAVAHAPEQRSCAYVDAHERVAEAMKDIDGAVVRATGFFSAYASLLPMAKKGMLFDIGDGKRKTNPICERDLAEIICDVALGGDGPRDIAAGGPEIMTRREIFEAVAAASGRNVKVRGTPVWIAGAMGAVMRAFHPRIGQFVQFAVGLAKHDVIAPALGTTKLRDYLESFEDEGRRTAA